MSYRDVLEGRDGRIWRCVGRCMRSYFMVFFGWCWSCGWGRCWGDYGLGFDWLGIGEAHLVTNDFKKNIIVVK